MYRNLNAECARAGVTKNELAKVLNIAPSSLWRKLRMRSGLKFCEAAAIKDFLKADIPLETLFEFDPIDEIEEEQDLEKVLNE